MFLLAVPAYNEARTLPQTIPRLYSFLQKHIQTPWRVCVVDNGSSDGTLQVARRLCKGRPRLSVFHLAKRGKGGAIREAWMRNKASTYAFCDADLATDLSALPALLKKMRRHDLVIGDRYHFRSRSRRAWHRSLLSRSYNLLVRSLFGIPVSDAQCGFKAASAQAVRELLPLVRDRSWFFDTELLVLAHSRGYSLASIPVTWNENPKSKVRLAQVTAENLRKLFALRARLNEEPAKRRADK